MNDAMESAKHVAHTAGDTSVRIRETLAQLGATLKRLSPEEASEKCANTPFTPVKRLANDVSSRQFIHLNALKSALRLRMSPANNWPLAQMVSIIHIAWAIKCHNKLCVTILRNMSLANKGVSSVTFLSIEAWNIFRSYLQELTVLKYMQAETYYFNSVSHAGNLVELTWVPPQRIATQVKKYKEEYRKRNLNIHVNQVTGYWLRNKDGVSFFSFWEVLSARSWPPELTNGQAGTWAL